MSEMTGILRYGQLIKKLYGNMLRTVTEKYEMTRNEVDVLLFLANNPPYDTEKDIVKLRSLSKSHVCKSVDSLMRRGYLAGKQDEGDRRRLHLEVLPAADPVVREARAVQKALKDLLYRDITEEERKLLEGLSQKILHNLEEALGDDR